MRKAIAVLVFTMSFVLTASAKPNPAPKKQQHAIVKVAKFLNPLSISKKSLGAIVFAAENVVDVIHFSSVAVDAAFSAQFKPYEPIHYIAVSSAKLDAGMEKAELYFFGSSN